MTGREPEDVPGALPWTGLVLLGLPGIGVAAYLTYAHWADRPTACGGIGDCELVQTSEYSDIAGIPVALLGVLYFAALTVVAGARLRGLPAALDWGNTVAFSMALAATAFVSYLTYLELAVLDAICIWCVSLATLTVASLGLAAWALFREGRG